MIGKTYSIPPQPPVPGNLITFEAGNISIGVEYRDLDPEGLVATYRDNPAHLAELLDRSPEGGFTDEGVSLHVFDAADGHEYVRFDVFDGDPTTTTTIVVPRWSTMSSSSTWSLTATCCRGPSTGSGPACPRC